MDPAPLREGPDSYVELRPVIEELIRTRYCPESITLVVDRIVAAKVPRTARGDRAFRLWLSDGVKSIQAIVKHELHPFIAAQTITEGSYVVINKYSLKVFPRLSAQGEVFVVLVSDMQSIGHDRRETTDWQSRMIETSPTKQQVKSSTETKSLAKETTTSIPKELSPEAEIETEEEVSLVPVSSKRSAKPKPPPPTPPRLSPEKRKREPPDSPLAEINDNGASPRSTKREKPTSSPQNSPTASPLKSQKSPTPSPLKSSPLQPPPSRQLKPISRPLKITPLSRLTGARVVRNQVHDVLAVVCEVDDGVVSRRGMPDQRNLRITDCSTSKLVQLTVFVDAATFQPAPGTVAVFRQVTTHEWNGGSLKAYPRDCKDWQWFFPEPAWAEPAWVEPQRVAELRAKWARMTEAEDRKGDSGDRSIVK